MLNSLCEAYRFQQCRFSNSDYFNPKEHCKLSDVRLLNPAQKPVPDAKTLNALLNVVHVSARVKR
jgi:hypothetical protein